VDFLGTTLMMGTIDGPLNGVMETDFFQKYLYRGNFMRRIQILRF
jgi:hypothetical protein